MSPVRFALLSPVGSAPLGRKWTRPRASPAISLRLSTNAQLNTAASQLNVVSGAPLSTSHSLSVLSSEAETAC